MFNYHHGLCLAIIMNESRNVRSILFLLHLMLYEQSLNSVNSALGKPFIYLLLKIHKPDNPGRPIVSACSCTTKHISDLLNSILQPIVSSFLPTSKTLIMLSILSLTSLIPSHSYLLFVLDVSSIYTSIPYADDLKALSHYLNNASTPAHLRLFFSVR
jgi:hypothetical protein